MLHGEYSVSVVVRGGREIGIGLSFALQLLLPGHGKKGGKDRSKKSALGKESRKDTDSISNSIKPFSFFLNEGYFQFVMFGLNKPIEKEYFVILCH